MKFICPHCGEDSDAVRIQGADELSFITDVGELRELWQCDCGGYFRLIFKLTEIECFQKVDCKPWVSYGTGGTGMPNPMIKIKTGQG